MVRESFRTTYNLQWHRSDGTNGLARALVYAGHGLDAGTVLLDQRVHDVFAFDDWHVPALVGRAAWESALGSAVAPFTFGAVLCVGILVTNICMKLFQGGWLTLVVTSSLVAVAFLIHWYYCRISDRIKVLDAVLSKLPATPVPNEADPDLAAPTAVILVNGFDSLGVHTMLDSLRFVPDHFRSFVFVSAGIVDSGNFKGSDAIEGLRKHTDETLDKYVVLARRLGMAAAAHSAIGTDAVDALEKVCLEVRQRFPKAMFFAGHILFTKETWIDRLLQHQTAFSLHAGCNGPDSR